MKENEQEWKRPQDVELFRTSDPKVMLGKYLPKPVLKTWTEDLVDDSTGEVVTLERHQFIIDRGYIDQAKIQEIMFAIQAGDIQDVEVSEENVQDVTFFSSRYPSSFMVELHCGVVKQHVLTRAQNIPQAITIAGEFEQMYRSIGGVVHTTKVSTAEVNIIPDDDQCIPEEDRKPANEEKNYFKVTVRTEWIENMKLKHYDIHYVVAADNVGQAKDRIALHLDFMRADEEPVDDSQTNIRKAVPFKVDCVVPKEFSDLYYEEPTN